MLYKDRNELTLDSLAEGAALAQKHQVLVEFLWGCMQRVKQGGEIMDAVYLTLSDLDIDFVNEDT